MIDHNAVPFTRIPQRSHRQEKWRGKERSSGSNLGGASHHRDADLPFFNTSLAPELRFKIVRGENT
jgi:hypothetical protein